MLPILINFSADRFSGAYTGKLLNYLSMNTGAFSSGPLWFVMMLLVFGLVYHLIRVIYKKPIPAAPKGSYRHLWMALIVGFVTGITYLIRIISPVGNWLDLPLLGFQPAHITQYILCFSLGIAASRWNILETITNSVWKKSLITGQILILLVFPAIFLLSGIADETE